MRWRRNGVALATRRRRVGDATATRRRHIGARRHRVDTRRVALSGTVLKTS